MQIGDQIKLLCVSIWNSGGGGSGGLNTINQTNQKFNLATRFNKLFFAREPRTVGMT